MNTRNICITALSVLALMAGSGCAVQRGQESVGQYVDDSVITTQIKSRMTESTAVAASSISVETLKGTVMLTGFAKSNAEKAAAEKIARDINGVKSVRNDIAIRP